MLRKHPDIFCFTLVILKSRSARLLSKGTSKSYINANEKRQTAYIPPPPKLEFTEHCAEIRKCQCGRIHAAAFPAGIESPIQYGQRIRAYMIYFNVVQFFYSLQCVSGMSFLTSIFVFSFVAQTFRYASDISRRWLAAVMAVFTYNPFKTVNLLVKRINLVYKSGDQRNNSRFSLVIYCTDFIFRHINRHEDKLISWKRYCIVSHVNILCLSGFGY